MKFKSTRLAAPVCLALFAATAASHATDDPQSRIEHVVDTAIQPAMAKYRIPGIAVGIVAGGRSYVFNYGVASTETSQPVTDTTLFEIGSISKTFTATLASWAQVNGELSLSDTTDKYLPALRNSHFGGVSLLNLGTHTPGGFPLQVPEQIRNDDQLMAYLKTWEPTCAPGSCRTYANPSIGMLGQITAKRMGQDFATLIEQRLFPALGMKHSYIAVPATSMADYAQGYTKDDVPARLTGGMLSAEAYGIKATAADITRFMEANMGVVKLDEKLQRAITDTHTAYFKAGVITQDLIWEQYPYPAALQTLLEGNSPAMLNATPVTAIQPPQAPREDVWINKTGATNGFGAYVAFIPAQRLGIVILANKNYPNEARVAIAHQILTALGGGE